MGFNKVHKHKKVLSSLTGKLQFSVRTADEPTYLIDKNIYRLIIRYSITPLASDLQIQACILNNSYAENKFDNNMKKIITFKYLRPSFLNSIVE